MLRHVLVHILFVMCAIALIVFGSRLAYAGIYWIALVLAYLGVIAYGTFTMSAGFFLTSICKGRANTREIALTFDDGPVDGTSEKVLSILAERKVEAAFFCIGRRVDEAPAIARRMIDEGHIIGNHSYLHGTTFSLQSSEKIHRELEETNRAVEKCVGVRPRFFRPPYGITNPMIASAVKKGNYLSIGWSVRSFDTVAKDPLKLMKRITHSLKGGDIVLLHDRCEITSEILPNFLSHLERSGFKIVRLDKLLNEPAYS